jgi:hypothetical protein
MMSFLPAMLVAAFNGILFTQSGLDKVLHYGGNLAYFKDHFKGSPLAPTVPLLLPAITLMEVSAGLLSLAGVVFFLLNGQKDIGHWGQAMAAISLLSLFFGQRVAKDYAGAASLAPYFLVAVAGVWLWG